ncbi:MAG: DUF5591 domain-containing protein [Candidatus Thermoplasmatota archaeon]|nr:DUF5591 domain-containing protein [Candidatus Thermoplasmatota archaeon]
MFIDSAFFGFARAGSLNDKISYPVVLDLENPLHSTFADSITAGIQVPWNFVTGKSDFVESGEEYLIIPELSSLIQKPRRLISIIQKIRNDYGFRRLIYAQGYSDPYLLPILVYLGISIFDDTTAKIEGLENIRYTQLGRVRTSSNQSDHNSAFLRETAELCDLSIRNDTLRNMVERYIMHPKAMELIRLSDSLLTQEFEITYPRRTPEIFASTLDSLVRPDLLRYKAYISNEYTRSDNGDIALLIPCTAKKPYSQSMTHQRLFTALGKRRRGLHEIIITSPVGVVPRDLERTYPPAFYDIPVTGNWYLEEKEMISSMIRDYFSRNSYRKVIAFVDSSLGFIESVLPPASDLIIWDKKNREKEFDELNSRLDSYMENNPKSGSGGSRLHEYVSIAKYQFGSWIEKYILTCRIVRNYDRDMLVSDGKPSLVFHEDRGFFSITKNAAQWFLENGKFLVEIDDFKPTANIYAVGVKGATDDIRLGDEVVIHSNGEIRGVGTAKMPVDAMTSLKKGVAVKVR